LDDSGCKSTPVYLFEGLFSGEIYSPILKTFALFYLAILLFLIGSEFVYIFILSLE